MLLVNRFTLVSLIVGALGLGLIGCSGASQTSGNAVLTVNEMMNQLRKNGLQVSPIRSISPNFAQDGILAETGYGDRIRIVEFQNSANASMEISRKSSSAGSAPYFYQKGNIMVVHLGNDSRVSKVLESVLGSKKR